MKIKLVLFSFRKICLQQHCDIKVLILNIDIKY